MEGDENETLDGIGDGLTCHGRRGERSAEGLFKPRPVALPALKENTVPPEKIDLGKALVFDPRLSASGVRSRSSRYTPATGGDDKMKTGVGHGWQTGPRNSPTLLNTVLDAAQVRDGRTADLAVQTTGPIQAGIELAERATSCRPVPTVIRIPFRRKPHPRSWSPVPRTYPDAPIATDRRNRPLPDRRPPRYAQRSLPAGQEGSRGYSG